MSPVTVTSYCHQLLSPVIVTSVCHQYPSPVTVKTQSHAVTHHYHHSLSPITCHLSHINNHCQFCRSLSSVEGSRPLKIETGFDLEMLKLCLQRYFTPSSRYQNKAVKINNSLPPYLSYPLPQFNLHTIISCMSKHTLQFIFFYFKYFVKIIKYVSHVFLILSYRGFQT